MSSFQARYAIRHSWPGAIDCKEPQRGIWGAPWADAGAKPEAASATKLGLEAHGKATLASFTSATGADLNGTALAAKAPDADAGLDAGTVDPPKPAPSKCGCRVVGAPSGDHPFGMLLLGMHAATRLRRRER